MRIACLLTAAVLLVTGCSHPMVISPALSNLQNIPESQKIAKKVGYYISPTQRALEANTAGSSGDRVTYKPYRDIETGLYMVLGNVFADVTRLDSLSDQAAIAKAGIDYIVMPEVTTTSGMTNALVWMPGQFNMNLACSFTHADGSPLMSVKVAGEGKASIGETTSNMSIAGIRASEDALNKLQQALLAAPQLRAAGK